MADREPTEEMAARREARPKATGVHGADPHATRLTRIEMALDDLADRVDALYRSIRGGREVVVHIATMALDPKTLKWLVALALGTGVLLGGGSLAVGEVVSLGKAEGDCAAPATQGEPQGR